MNILINGNLGYIGPIVARHLRSEIADAKIYGFDSGFFAGCLVDPVINPDVVLDGQFYGDVRNPPDGLFDGMDVVIQLAAISNDPMGKAYEEVTEQVNAEAAAECARRARAAGVKHFVFASSCSVYGAAGEEARTEESELNPLTAYARSKIAAEKALQPLAGPDFTVTCLRFATACGFSPRLRLDLVLNDFVASALATGKIEILSDGTPWRPLIEVRDMARAIHWAGTRDNTAGDFLVVNAGSNEWNYRVVELAEAVKAHLGDVEVSINQNASPDKRSYRVDFSRFASLAPDFQPQVDLASAVSELVSGLTAVNFSDQNFRESYLIRLKVLNAHREAGRLDNDLRWRIDAPVAVC